MQVFLELWTAADNASCLQYRIFSFSGVVHLLYFCQENAIDNNNTNVGHT